MDKPLLHILLIEDNPADAIFLEASLEKDAQASYQVSKAERLSEGLARVRENHFDAILLDLGLPESHGLETFKRVYLAASDVPIVVLSGLMDEDVALRAVQAGAQDYLVKGTAGWEFMSRSIRYAIERKRMEDEIRKLNTELEQRVIERTAELSEANALLQAMMDNIPDQIYFKDRKSCFIRNSRAQAELMGLNDPEEAVGKSDFDFFPHAQRSFEEEQEVMRSGQPLLDIEEYVVWPSGRVMWVSTSKAPLMDHAGRTMGIFGISRDITERKYAEENLKKAKTELETANKELESFSYSVSHDLRAPLRAINGYTNILLEDYGSILDEEGKRVCGVISRETKRMGRLIDDLLSFSRMGRREVRLENIDMKAIVNSVFDELLKEVDPSRIEVRVGDLHSASGDPTLLRQVWINLLSNGIKFTSRKMRAIVEVDSSENEQGVIYSVRDNGAGFDMEYANKLFGVFQRLHSESEFEGTGVGLAIVQRVIHRHGGRVWAESKLNEGATFHFSLPRSSV